MKGDPQVIRHLNSILTSKLTAINQYFLQSRMLRNIGLLKLGEHIQGEARSKMQQADRLIERILFLEGVPNLQDLQRIDAGDDVPVMINLDMDSEERGRNTVLEAVKYCEEVRDFVSRELLTGILSETEAHIDWLTYQIRLIDAVGAENYKQEQMFE
jgi:bacterioferritin